MYELCIHIYKIDYTENYSLHNIDNIKHTCIEIYIITDCQCLYSLAALYNADTKSRYRIDRRVYLVGVVPISQAFTANIV